MIYQSQFSGGGGGGWVVGVGGGGGGGCRERNKTNVISLR